MAQFFKISSLRQIPREGKGRRYETENLVNTDRSDSHGNFVQESKNNIVIVTTQTNKSGTVCTRERVEGEESALEAESKCKKMEENNKDEKFEFGQDSILTCAEHMFDNMLTYREPNWIFFPNSRT